MPNLFSDTFLEKLKYYIEDYDPLRMSRNLRKAFFDYLKFQNGVSANDFDSILTDVESILELMDTLAEERNSRDRKA